jgi:hypothetical protein
VRGTLKRGARVDGSKPLSCMLWKPDNSLEQGCGADLPLGYVPPGRSKLRRDKHVLKERKVLREGICITFASMLERKSLAPERQQRAVEVDRLRNRRLK